MIQEKKVPKYDPKLMRIQNQHIQKYKSFYRNNFEIDLSNFDTQEKIASGVIK